MRECQVAGCNNKHYGKGYCQKHYIQIRQYGKILTRTRKDPNEIIVYDNYAEIVLYDNYGKEINKALIDLDDIEIEHIQIPEETLNAVRKFMEEMNYMDDDHFLGIIVYGSSLTGFNTEISDIDLHVVFDNSDPSRMIRGEKLVDGKKIEYFEKPIDDEYLMAENEFLNQNNASLPILGKGEIVFARDDSLINLQKYVLHRFQDKLPPLNIDEAREQISIIDNKIQKCLF